MISPNIEFRLNPPSPIRDTVHNYIRTTKLEINTIDTPEFQRLRDILQNSTAYLTFPCNTNTRFTHSLGVMHVAGKIFIAALKNAEPKVLLSFLEDVSNLISHHMKMGGGNEKAKVQTYEKQWGELLGHISRFSHNPELFESTEISNNKYTKPFDPYFVINTMWQVVRLGALMHDFGHLPMSHVFESAIQSTLDTLRKTRDDENDNATVFELCMGGKLKSFENTADCNYPEFKGHLFKNLYDDYYVAGAERKLHEELGLHAFCSMYHGRYEEYPELIKDITIKVLASPPHATFLKRDEEPARESDRLSLYSFLHSIFDNDFIDADRIDYCLRDPLSSGSELGAFDSERVINSCTLVEEDGAYRLAHNYKSIGAIESLFFQRHLTYTGIIYHHSILRMNALIKRILRELILYFNDHHADKDDPIIATLIQYNFFGDSDESSVDYVFMSDNNISSYDESWLKTMLRSLQRRCQEIKKETDPGDKVSMIGMLIETYLERKVGNLVSIWKSSKDCQSRLKLELCNFEKFNSLVRSNDNDYVYDDLLNELEDHFASQGIVFLAEKVSLPKFAENPLFVDRVGKVGSVDSIALRALSEMSDSMLTINFFLVGDSLKSSEHLPSYIDKVATDFSVYVNYLVNSKETVDN